MLYFKSVMVDTNGRIIRLYIYLVLLVSFFSQKQFISLLFYFLTSGEMLQKCSTLDPNKMFAGNWLKSFTAYTVHQSV